MVRHGAMENIDLVPPTGSVGWELNKNLEILGSRVVVVGEGFVQMENRSKWRAVLNDTNRSRPGDSEMESSSQRLNLSAEPEWRRN
jgi:hypothetical protein